MRETKPEPAMLQTGQTTLDGHWGSFKVPRRYQMRLEHSIKGFGIANTIFSRLRSN